MIRRPPRSTLFPYTTSSDLVRVAVRARPDGAAGRDAAARPLGGMGARAVHQRRSEEHTSELQSHVNLVCRLLLEKKKLKYHTAIVDTKSCGHWAGVDRGLAY